MKKVVSILFLAIILLIGLAYAQETCSVGTCLDTDGYCVYYFYGEGCSHCAVTSPFISSILENYPNFTLKKFEIYFNSSSQELFQDFIARYGIKKAGIPAIFIGDRALLGENVIVDNLELTLDYFNENEPICPLSYKIDNSHNISPSRDIKLTFWAVIIAALADSINPCAFAVLIFLLIYLSSIASKKRMLKIGTMYIFTVFLVYFLSGLGLFIFAQKFGITRIIFNIAAWIAIFAGTINIKDFFWYGKGISLAIPEKAKGSIEKYIHFASLPAAFILGVLVSMFELPCTGGVYLAILSLLASTLTRVQAIPWLLLYNFIFVLPLIIILLLVVFGYEAGKADKIRLEKRKWLRLVMGLIMVGLGLAMLLGIFG